MVDRQSTEHGRHDEADERHEPESLREDEPSEQVDSREHQTGGERDRKAEEPGKTRRRSPWRRAILILVLLVAVIGGIYYWWSTKDIESTDDAFTDGRAVMIAPHVSGYVIALEVTDNQFVKQGDVLLEIDPRDFIAARDQAQANVASVRGQLDAAKYASEVARKNFPAQLAQAQAQLASARANLFKAQTDYQRQHTLSRAATTQQEIDASTAALQQAQAQVAQADAQVQQATPVPQNIGQVEARVEQLEGMLKQAQAQLDQANLNLAWTKVTAPQDGWITKRSVEKGNLVQSGQNLLSIVTPEVWVTANFKETQLKSMRPGQAVNIYVDANGKTYKGHVDSVSGSSGARLSLLPPENATGNYVKVVQRVPVKIVFEPGQNDDHYLRLGMSVEPKVFLK